MKEDIITVVIHDRGKVKEASCPVCGSHDVFYEGEVPSYPGQTLDEISSAKPVCDDDYVCDNCGSVFIITRVGDSMRHRLIHATVPAIAITDTE